jgi:hypothetical protein
MSAIDRKMEKFQAKIDSGIGSVGAVLDRIHNEIPRDRLVNSRNMAFTPVVGHPGYALKLNDEVDDSLHNFALGQVAERVGLPADYISKLEARGEEGRNLVATNLDRLYQIDPAKKLLVRSVKDQVRGVVTDRFRRLDSRPIIDSFIGAVDRAGARPFDGHAGDTKFSIRAVVPKVFEAFAGEVVAFGVSIANSDFGNGALSLRVFIWRVWCENLAQLEESMREVHLGSRLVDGVEFRQATINAETKASALAVEDIIKGSLSATKIDETMSLIKRANDKVIEPKEFFRSLQKNMGLLKSEFEAVQDTYNTGGVEELPPGNTLYRMSNAISWIAQKATTPERRFELEAMAGKVMLQAAA